MKYEDVIVAAIIAFAISPERFIDIYADKWGGAYGITERHKGMYPATKAN